MMQVLAKRALGALLLALALAMPGQAAAQGTAGSDIRDDSPVLPSDRILNELDKAELRRLLQGLGVRDDATTATGLRRIVRVELIRTVARRGNNPFNVNDPINNNTQNGVTRMVAVDGNNNNNNNVGGGGGMGGGAGLANCIGQSLAGAPSPTAPADLRFISIRVDPITLNCTVAAGQSADGDFLILQFSPGPPSNLSLFPDALLPLWSIIDPMGGFIFLNPFVGQTLFVELRANNGRQVRATLTVTPVGANNFNLTIVNMVQTN